MTFPLITLLYAEAKSTLHKNILSSNILTGSHILNVKYALFSYYCNINDPIFYDRTSNILLHKHAQLHVFLIDSCNGFEYFSNQIIINVKKALYAIFSELYFDFENRVIRAVIQKLHVRFL